MTPTGHPPRNELATIEQRLDDQMPSGRHGGPWVESPAADRSRPRVMTAALTSESYIVHGVYEQAMKIIRRELSRQGLQILRECDLGTRIKRAAGMQSRDCRVLYLAEPALLLSAIAADVSAALWLPVPVVIVDEAVYTLVVFPPEAIVRDRASLLGVQELVQSLYARLTAALQAVGKRDESVRQ